MIGEIIPHYKGGDIKREGDVNAGGDGRQRVWNRERLPVLDIFGRALREKRG